MKKIIFTAVLFFSLLSFGQEIKTTYFDSLGKKSNIDLNLKKIVFEKKDEFYKISTFYKDKLSSVKIVEDTINYAKNMEETEYFENGKVSKTTKFLNNKLSGDIVEYYNNGLKKSIYFTEYDKSYNTIYTIKEFWNKEGIQQVSNGNGKYEFDIVKDVDQNDRAVLKGNVVNGLFDGKFSSNPNEFPYFEEYYSKGIFLNGTRKISKTDSKHYTEIAIQPKPNNGMNEFRREIGSKIKTDKQKTTINGTVAAKFYVDPNGKIQNPIIVKSLNEYFDNQLIEILNNSENWAPGIYRGLAIKSYYTIPLTIKLEY